MKETTKKSIFWGNFLVSLLVSLLVHHFAVTVFKPTHLVDKTLPEFIKNVSAAEEISPAGGQQMPTERKQSDAKLDLLLAKLTYNDGDYKGTIEHCTKAIQLNPDDVNGYFYRALAALKLEPQQCLDAIADYENTPQDAVFYTKRGIATAPLLQIRAVLQDLWIASRIAERNGDERIKDKIDEAINRVVELKKDLIMLFE